MKHILKTRCKHERRFARILKLTVYRYLWYVKKKGGGRGVIFVTGDLQFLRLVNDDLLKKTSSEL